MKAKSVPSHQALARLQSATFGKQLLQTRQAVLSLLDDGKPSLAQAQINKALPEAQGKHDKLAEGLLQADLCMIDIELKKYDEAHTAGSAAVKILSALPGVTQKDLSLALRGLGIACAHQGDLTEAQTVLTRSCQLDQVVYGPHDERYAIGLGRLAKVLESEKKYDEAEAYFRQALQVSESCHQLKDPHLPNRMTALATFLRTRHRRAEAQTLERKARQIANKEGIRRNQYAN